MTRRGPIAYSAAELQFVKARASMARVELHAAFVERFSRGDVTVDHIKSLCTRNGWATRERFTRDDDALLRELYPDTPTHAIATRLGRSMSTIYQRARRLGLEKSEAYLASPAACRLRRGDNVGAATRFPKGHAPANKGLRRPGWSPGRMKETQFVKGARSGKAARNWRPIGSERLVDGYRYTKVSDVPNVPYTVNWKPTHMLRWEAVNGPLPKGHALKSLDGVRVNVDPANWIAVPRALLPRLNGRHRRGYDSAPAELKPTILAIAKLEHAAAEADGLTPVQRMIKRRRERDKTEQRPSSRRRRRQSEALA